MLSENLEPEENENVPQIESPVGLLPDLSLWGIEEVDKGVCEDSADNRRLLRENHASWIIVYAADGKPTNLIQAVTPEMKEARLLANKSILLKDTRNPDSDYITGLDLIIEPRADDLVPAWVLAASRKWEDIAEERARRGAGEKTFRPAIAGPPSRCRARRVDGHRCQNWTGGRVQEDGLCKMHIATKAGHDENFGVNIGVKVRNRLLAASLGAAEGLEELAQTAVSEPVRLGAYKEILDRSGFRGGFEIEQKVEVTVTNAEEIVRKRLDEIARRAAERREIEARAEAEAQEHEIIEVHVIKDEDEDQ